MRLILQEYLSSLKERDGLDAMLPDLLLQMGLEVFSKPSVGGRQYGVDVAAFGKMDGDDEDRVYLFSIKAGNIDRSTWSGKTNQDLRPSLEEILDVYIGNTLPEEYRNNKIVICICCGGNIEESVRQNIKGFIDKHTSDVISFAEWNGDKMSILIEKYLLREKLVPKGLQSDLRRTLALLSNHQESTLHFEALLKKLHASCDGKNDITVLRQISISLWIVFAWCDQIDNYRVAINASESAVLFSWDIIKNIFNKKSKAAKCKVDIFSSILSLYMSVLYVFINKKIMPYVSVRHGLSVAVKSHEPLDVNRSMFWIASQLSMMGLWAMNKLSILSDNDLKGIELLQNAAQEYNSALRNLVCQNRSLLAVYDDDSAIELYICLYFLALFEENLSFVEDWMNHIVILSDRSYLHNIRYPSTVSEYEDLLYHPIVKSNEYKIEVTSASVLFPMLGMFSAFLGFDKVYKRIEALEADRLPYCNFQYWFPDEKTEDNLYVNTAVHGKSLLHLSLRDGKEGLIEKVKSECESTSHFKSLSALMGGVPLLAVLACKKYRYPVPAGFLETFWSAPDRC